MKPKRTILCVDDNEQSLSHRKIMLETRGYRVASFSRGEEALARFVQGGVDLVIADMAMPGLDGPQLIAKIKDVSPHTPAILISSKVRIYNHDSQARRFPHQGHVCPRRPAGARPALAGAQARTPAHAAASSSSCAAGGRGLSFAPRAFEIKTFESRQFE